MADGKATSSKRTVLITGCSDGGLGSALAIALHKAGLHVYATARNPSKLEQIKAHGIETLILDVLSDSSIAECVNKVPSLDILVNNAGAVYAMPVSDLSIAEAKKLFDLNVWSYIAVTQAFLPLLIKSKGMIVNHTSVGSLVTLPFQSAYNASKAAMAMFSNTQKLELEPFGITVVDLKTAAVKSNITQTQAETNPKLPKNSIWEPARELVEVRLRGEGLQDNAMPAAEWAALVTKDLLKKKPSPQIWRGNQAWLAWLGTIVPHGSLDWKIKEITQLDQVEKILRG